MATETKYEELVDALNHLITLNHDRERGYLKASEDVEDADLKPLFQSLSDDSSNFASELADAVRKLNGTPATGQTLAGKVHQVWLDVKAAISGHDRDAVISSVQFGDNAAGEAYDKVLDLEKLAMIPDLASILSRQRDAIQRGLGIVTTAKDHPDSVGEGTGHSGKY